MNRKPMLVLGLMSGTSADGIDVALARISGAPPHLKAKLLGHTSSQFPAKLRKEILRVAEQRPSSAGELSQLNFRLAGVLADAAISACRTFRVARERVSLIGSHGQTIFHQGAPVPYFGQPTASTLQIGEPSVIAARTGITTIGDFRPADMALGGQGAPLVPYADYVLYRHAKLGRVSLNLGGIANITVIPAGAKPQEVIAFDTGPANMLIDALVSHFTRGRQRFDKDGVLAQKGQINRPLMTALLNDPYLKQPPPKSTGREYFGSQYLLKLLALSRHYRVQRYDLIRTVTVFTAASVIDALHRFVLPKHKIDEIIVSGGGVNNPVIFETLSVLAATRASARDVYCGPSHKKYITWVARGGKLNSREAIPSFVSVLPSSRFALPEDAKEAFAFALLAYETFHHRSSNIPSATGALGPAILGKICCAPPR